MENFIFLIMILIFIFQGIANILKRREESRKEIPVPQEEEHYEVLPPREEEPITVPEETIPPLPEEWQEELPEVVEEPYQETVSRTEPKLTGSLRFRSPHFPISQEKAAEKIASLVPAVPYEREELIKIGYMAGLTTEKLKDGIILSTILGPPKAYKFMGRV
ncbi:MAG: hypothetical protein HYY56_06090 [Candidatus Omnitrophica bacterium]|nr:hypothetical protein [Candidatus Omnitrophota bacterium]